MKKICFITGTRADYGIMAPIMRLIQSSPDAVLQIVATTMHLSSRFGMTINEIKKDGFKVDWEIESLLPGDTSSTTAKSMALVQQGLADALEDLQPDLIVILGDRYEALAAASTAVVFDIPIAHLHGGEITEGAMDDMLRNAITKLSSYHFASTPEYAARIVSMGENPDCVFHSGAPGAEIRPLVDEIILSQDFQRKTGFSAEDKFILLAMHPVTLLPDRGENEVRETIKALDSLIDYGYKILVTMPNSDPGNTTIYKMIDLWKEEQEGRVVTVKSLGATLFHYAMHKACAITGNSSAALIEAPSLKLPTVNIGSRQKGRAAGPSVLHALGDAEDIKAKLNIALSTDFHQFLDSLTLPEINPYYKAGSSRFIAEKLLKI